MKKLHDENKARDMLKVRIRREKRRKQRNDQPQYFLDIEWGTLTYAEAQRQAKACGLSVEAYIWEILEKRLSEYELGNNPESAETFEVASDPKVVQMVAQSQEDIQRGNVHPLTDLLNTSDDR